MKWEDTDSELSEDSDRLLSEDLESRSDLGSTASHSASDIQSDPLTELEKQYIDVSSPIGYSDVKTIHRHFKGRLNKTQIKDFLSTKDAYTLTKRTRRAKYYNMTYCRGLRQNIQMDVFYMQEFHEQNDGCKHILLGVDVWSRYMWACPIKNTTGAEGLRGTQKILEQAGGFTTNLTLDKGSEFVSNKYKKYIQGLNIKLHYTNSKASIVERAILTLKRYIYRFMAETDKVRYIDKLQNFVDIYNDHFHRFLQMSPREAEEKRNQKKVKMAHNKKKKSLNKQKQKPRFKLGDKVRLSRIKNRMTRGYDTTYNYEIFEIYKINIDLPIPRYYVKQPETGEEIKGCFYANEIVLVRQHKYKIIILKERKKRGKKEYLVKWKGYPGMWLNLDLKFSLFNNLIITDSFNEWLPEDRLETI